MTPSASETGRDGRPASADASRVFGWRPSRTCKRGGATRVATGGARCVGCGDLFQPDEPHVEVLAGADPAARDPVSADDQEDEA